MAEQADTWGVLEEFRLTPGMFIAQVVGHSMEPLVPSGSFCLFRPVPGGTKDGRKLLVWHEGVADDETGGQFTLKVYRSEKVPSNDDGGHKVRIVLSPLNPEFSPIELDASDEEKVRVIAELVRVLQ